MGVLAPGTAARTGLASGPEKRYSLIVYRDLIDACGTRRSPATAYIHGSCRSISPNVIRTHSVSERAPMGARAGVYVPRTLRKLLERGTE